MRVLQSRLRDATITYHNGVISCTYYGTVIARLKNDSLLTLDTGGHLTNTTKAYINEFLEAFEIPIQVIQRKGNWYTIRPDCPETPFIGSLITFEINRGE